MLAQVELVGLTNMPQFNGLRAVVLGKEDKDQRIPLVIFKKDGTEYKAMVRSGNVLCQSLQTKRGPKMIGTPSSAHSKDTNARPARPTSHPPPYLVTFGVEEIKTMQEIAEEDETEDNASERHLAEV